MTSAATLSAWICVIYTFGATIFFVLLCIERPVWALQRERDARGEAITAGAAAFADEPAVRRIHATLKSLIPLLPPANGAVVIGGTALLVWQAIGSSWHWQAIPPLVFYVAVLLWTIFGLHIAASVRDVRTTPSDAPFPDVASGVARLIRAHRDGLANTCGTLALQLGLIVHGPGGAVT